MFTSGIRKQIGIYFRKTVRIAFHEHFWKSLVFSAIVGVVISYVIGEKMFETFENTQSGFFTLCSACVWIGIFNSIQIVCREHEIIHADCRSGMSIPAYVISHILWEFILCVMEAAIIYLISTHFIDYNEHGIVFEAAALDYFITFVLLVFCSDCMGIMVSAIAKDQNMAMVIMPFVLIFQLILAGTLFELEGFSQNLSNITFTKWGMSAFGSISDLDNRALFPLKIARDLPPGLEIPPVIHETYEHTRGTLLHAWGSNLLVAFGCSVIATVVLKIRNRGS